MELIHDHGNNGEQEESCEACTGLHQDTDPARTYVCLKCFGEFTTVKNLQTIAFTPEAIITRRQVIELVSPCCDADYDLSADLPEGFPEIKPITTRCAHD